MWFSPPRNTHKHLFTHQRALKTKEMIWPESSLGNQWVLRGCLQKHGWPRQLHHWRAHPNTADDSWNLHPGSFLHDLQAAHWRISPLSAMFSAYHKHRARLWDASNFLCFLSLVSCTRFLSLGSFLSSLSLKSQCFNSEETSTEHILRENSSLLSGRSPSQLPSSPWCFSTHIG